MTSALAIFGVPAWVTVTGVCLLMGDHGAERPLLDLGKVGAWRFAPLNLIYIPGAFLVHPHVSDCASAAA